MQTEDEKTDCRLPQQFGIFGEYLVMFWLGQTLGYSVAIVDHVGADIIASKENCKRLAVSVKSRIFKKDDPGVIFSIKSNEKLRHFAKKFECEPAVAFVFIDKTGIDIDVYLIELDIFEELCEDEKQTCFSKCKDGLGITNARTKQSALWNNEYIRHIRLKSESPLFR